MDAKSDAGPKIRELRGSETQEQFAETVGADQGQLSRWESGAAIPSVESWIRLGAFAAQEGDPAKALFFWTQTGLDQKLLFSLAESILKQRIYDPEVLEAQGKAVLVPPFTDGEWKMQQALPPQLMRAADIPNIASTYYLIATSWGRGFAPRDRIVFDRAGVSTRKIGPFLNQVILLRSETPLHLRRSDYHGSANISVGRLSEVNNGEAVACIGWDQRPGPGLYVHQSQAISLVSPGRLSLPGGRTIEEHRRIRADHHASRSEVVANLELPTGMEVLGCVRALIPGNVKGEPDQWNHQVETWESWHKR